MTSALLPAILLLLAPNEESSYREIETLFAVETPAPEPPAGLRAPAGTERHERARARYAEMLLAWKAEEQARRNRIVDLCDRHLAGFPRGSRRLDVLYLRGVVRFRSAEFAAARQDLETYLAESADGPAATAARAALVESCRALGDFAGALKHGGPEPDLLEEAGEVERAIEAAKLAGQDDKARGWALIGLPFPGPIHIPTEGVAAVVVQAGRSLPKERLGWLQDRFSAEKEKVLFISAAGPYPQAVYLLDRRGVVRAVDPRPDTLEHRIRRLVGRG